jgi:hypothetical protein
MIDTTTAFADELQAEYVDKAMLCVGLGIRKLEGY